jgi:hypothetical protein
MRTRRERRAPTQTIAADSGRDVCSRCGAVALVTPTGAVAVMLTVTDVLGNQDVVCLTCWREVENARRGQAS